MTKFNSDMALQCLASLVMISNSKAYSEMAKETARLAASDYTLLLYGIHNNNYSKHIEDRFVGILKEINQCPKTFIEALGVDYTE